MTSNPPPGNEVTPPNSPDSPNNAKHRSREAIRGVSAHFAVHSQKLAPLAESKPYTVFPARAPYPPALIRELKPQ